MTSAGPHPDTAAAVLYVCADRSPQMPGLATQRAEEEARAFAQQHGLTIAEIITDEFGEPNPQLRQGWQRVRDLAAAGTFATVLIRWPSAIAPECAHEARYRETSWLQDHGVRIRYTWAPLADADGATS